jgi:uncharacterized membrane protein
MEWEPLYFVELSVTLVELIAVGIILVAVVSGLARFLGKIPKYRRLRVQDYNSFRLSLARTLILGLEIMVAADIIETVVLESSLQSVVVLGLLVLTRTFLSWSLVVEIEGRWPWQPKSESISGGI